jgi:hypothetical protein
MDTALVSSIVSAIIGQVQSAVVDRMQAAATGQGTSSAELIDEAQQNADSLLNLAAGIGTNVNLKV